MKITFLGTSHGVPAADRNCACTMLETGGAVYILDAGAPLMELLIQHGVDVNKVRAVVTTHYHADHVAGIPHFACLASWYFKEMDVDIYLTEQRGLDVFADPFGELNPERVRFHLMDAQAGYADGSIRFIPVPTKHLAAAGRPAYGYIVEAEGKRMLFTGDMSNRLAEDDFPAVSAEMDFDLIVSELAHFGVPEVEPYVHKCRTKQFAFTHVFPLSKYDDIEALKELVSFPILCPADGDELVL